MKNVLKAVEKRALDARGRQEEKRQLLVIKDRLEGLISSTVKLDITLKQGTEWSYDAIKKIISYPLEGKSGVKNCPAEVFIGTLLHEVGHAKYTSGIEKVIQTIPYPKKDYGFLLNTLEDIRIERKLVSRYPGTFDNLKSIKDYMETDGVEQSILDLPPHMNFLMNILRHEWGLPLYFSDDRIDEFFQDNFVSIHTAIDQTSSVKMHEYIKKNLWDKYKLLLQDEPQDPPDDSQDDPQDDPQDDGQDGDDGQDDDQEQDGGGGNGGEGNQDDSSPDLSGTMSLEDVINKLNENSNSQPQNTNQSLLDSLKVEPEKIEDTQGVAQAREDLQGSVVTGAKNYDYRTYEQLYATVEKHTGFFSKKLNSILVDNNLKRFGGAFKSGKLNTKLLYKWKCGNTRLFSRAILRQHKQYSICLLVDESGSMVCNDQHVRSTEAIVLLSEVLSIIGIPFEICGFNSTTRVYKQYDDIFNWSVKRNIEHIIPQIHTTDAYRTNDAYAIAWANSRLKKREGEKIMLVLSDGDPNPSKNLLNRKDRKFLPTTATSYTDLDLKTEIRKASTTSKLIGIGIDYDGVRNNYTNNIVCNNLSQLPSMLLKVLQKQIKRG